MILKKTDLTQRIHKETILDKIRSEKENFNLLLKWGQLSEQPLAWRSVWLLRQILERNDPRLKSSISEIISLFSSFNDSQKREWLKVLESQNLNADDEGVLFDLCVNEWKKISNHAALRASATRIIFSVLKKHPELKEELSYLMTHDYVEALSPGIRKGVLKSWADFNK